MITRPSRSTQSALPLRSSTDDDGSFETRRGGIRHQHRRVPKGIQMLRLERELRPILDKWREAVQRDPKAWK